MGQLLRGGGIIVAVFYCVYYYAFVNSLCEAFVSVFVPV